jgi:hypothetical protein
MPDKRSYDELLALPTRSWINQPIDYSVDFVVGETALERAHRLWGMNDDEKEPK